MSMYMLNILFLSAFYMKQSKILLIPSVLIINEMKSYDIRNFINTVLNEQIFCNSEFFT